MRRAVATTTLVCLLLVGCGSSSGSDGNEGSKSSGTKAPTAAGLEGAVNDHGTKTVSGGKVEVELDDDYFGPTYIKAPAGTKVTLELKNEGAKEHNFSLTGTEVSQDIEPGKSVDVEVTVPDASTAYFCAYHQGKGMQGAFIVT